MFTNMANSQENKLIYLLRTLFPVLAESPAISWLFVSLQFYNIHEYNTVSVMKRNESFPTLTKGKIYIIEQYAYQRLFVGAVERLFLCSILNILKVALL